MNARNVERVAPWTTGAEDTRPPLSAPLERELDAMRSEAAPMLDPSWTPAKGYGHASAILDALARADAERFGSLSSRKEIGQ